MSKLTITQRRIQLAEIVNVTMNYYIVQQNGDKVDYSKLLFHLPSLLGLMFILSWNSKKENAMAVKQIKEILIKLLRICCRVGVGDKAYNLKYCKSTSPSSLKLLLTT